MGLEKPSLASCLSRRTNWLCHPVFTLTTHCGGVCVATVGGSGRGRVQVNHTAVGSARGIDIPELLLCFVFEEEERPDASS